MPDLLNFVRSGVFSVSAHLVGTSLTQSKMITVGTDTAALVALSSVLFYAIERDHNPKVNDVFDAAIYCSTCLSVGYGDIFAKTPLGKLLGTALMTIG